MEQNNVLNIDFVNKEGNQPLVKFSFLDKENRNFECIMMVDTGCEDNHLYGIMKDYLPSSCFLSEPKTQISSTNGVIDAENVRMAFKLEDKEFEERFLLNDNQRYMKIDGHIIVGILGLPFLMKHGLILDFVNLSLHTKRVKDIDYDQMEKDRIGYAFIIHDVLRVFNAPVFVISKGDNDMLALIDTGAGKNAITQKAISKYGFDPTIIDEEQTVLTVIGISPIKAVEMDYSLSFCLDEEHIQQNYRDEFLVADIDCFKKPILTYRGSSKEPPVLEGLLGCKFLRREGWVLNFKDNILFIPRDKELYKSKQI